MRQSTSLLTKRRRPISGLELNNCTWECCGLGFCPACRRFPIFIYVFNPAVLDTVSVHLMAVCAHVSRVRSLYKRILVLHRFLPIELRALGDQYVKDEFRRHKSAEPKEVKSFMKEWENYKNSLQTQVLESAGERYSSVKFGDNLSQKKLNEFQDEQIGQLYELMVEATKSKRQFDIQEDRK